MAAKAAAAGSAPSAGVTRPTRRPPSRPGSRSAASVPAATSLATATAGTIEMPEPQLDQLLQHLDAAHLHGHRRRPRPAAPARRRAGRARRWSGRAGARGTAASASTRTCRRPASGWPAGTIADLLLARQRLQPQPPGQRAAAGPQVGRQGQGHHPDVHGPLRHPPGGGRRGPVVEPQVDAGVAGAEGGDHRRQEVAGQGVAGAHHQPPLPQLRSARSPSRARSISSRIRWARGSSAAPAGLSSVLRPRRVKRRAPRSCSRRDTSCETADCVRARAAPPPG